MVFLSLENNHFKMTWDFHVVLDCGNIILYDKLNLRLLTDHLSASFSKSLLETELQIKKKKSTALTELDYIIWMEDVDWSDFTRIMYLNSPRELWIAPAAAVCEIAHLFTNFFNRYIAWQFSALFQQGVKKMKQRICTVTNYYFFFPLLYLFNATRTRGITYSHDQINISCQRGKKKGRELQKFQCFQSITCFQCFFVCFKWFTYNLKSFIKCAKFGLHWAHFFLCIWNFPSKINL